MRALPDATRPSGLDPAPPAARILDWYRFDSGPRVLRVVLLSVAVMVVGMIGASAFVRTPDRGAVIPGSRRSPTRSFPVDARGRALPRAPIPPEDLWVGSAGVLVVLVGAGIGVFGLYRILAQDEYLALRADGVLLVEKGISRFVAWAEVDEVRHDAEKDALVVEVRGEGAWQIPGRFAEVDNAELARRVAALRRRALFGIG